MGQFHDIKIGEMQREWLDGFVAGSEFERQKNEFINTKFSARQMAGSKFAKLYQQFFNEKPCESKNYKNRF